jgi:hypothetical protein
MATVVRNALQGKRTANVWFKNVTLAEQSRDGHGIKWCTAILLG